MKQRIRLTETDLHRIIKESVQNILKEVTDYGNNIFGSSRMNPTYKEKYGVNREDYFELHMLARDIIEKFGNSTDRIENYTNDGIYAYLYGNTQERQDDLMKIKEYCEKRGYLTNFTNITRYSGHNQYTAVKIEFEKW